MLEAQKLKQYTDIAIDRKSFYASVKAATET